MTLVMESARDLPALLERCEHARVDADVLELRRLADEGVELAERQRDRRLGARFRGLAAFALWRLERAPEARDRALEALDDTDIFGTPEWRVDLRHTIAMAHTSLSAPADGLPYAHEALTLAREHVDDLGQGTVSWSLNRLAVVIDGLGDTPRAIDLLDSAARVAADGDADDAVFAARVNIAALARLAADRARVETDVELMHRYAERGLQALDEVRHLAEPVDYWSMLCAEHEASLTLFSGDPGASLAAVARHRAINERLQLPAQSTIISLTEVRSLLALGRVADAERLCEAELDEETFDAADMYMPRLLETRMLVLRATGRFEAALDVSERLRALERRTVRERIEAQMRILLRDAEIENARIEAERFRKQAVTAVQASLEDPLTGLGNRRALEQHFEGWSASKPRPDLAVAVIDVDHFKRINDAFGHDVGDTVLREVAALLKAGTRGDDLVIRSGGEEFVLVLPGCPLARATEVCERLRTRFADYDWDTTLPDFGDVTISIGLTASQEHDDSDSVLRRADTAMYDAKRAGRDRLEVAVADRPPDMDQRASA